jgi:hypothetical protein
VQIIEEIRGRLAATSGALSALREKRRPVALKAIQGDTEARKAVAAIEAEEAKARSEHITAELALEEAERLQEDDRRTAAEAEQQRRELAASEAAAELLSVAEQFDTKAAEMAQLLSRRRELVEVVRRAKVLPNGLLNRFLHREPVDRAMTFAGLQEFATIPRGGAIHRAPMATTDGTVIGNLARGAKHEEAA